MRIYDRLLIRGQISNTGGSPFSVMNEGKAFVQTKGYPYAHREDGGKVKQSYYPEDMQIAVLLPNGKGAYDVPISITPQEVHRCTAVSDNLIESLDSDGVLTNVFTAADRNCYLGVLVTLPGKDAVQPYHTVHRLFRDWKTDIDVPPAKRPWNRAY